MKAAVDELLTVSGWKHNTDQEFWTDPSKKFPGRIKVTVMGWHHLNPDITKKHDLGELAHGHSAADLEKYLKNRG